MKRLRITLLLLMVFCMNLQAQIGYQISLLNTATGEPRANETVNVMVTLTNSEGGIIYTGNQSATTNDFGVLSLTIGDADTFKEVDVTKMPFYVEVTANGVSIGKSQVLSVPVAEYAKRTGTLTKKLLEGTWVREFSYHGEVESVYDVSHIDGNGKKTIEQIPYTYTSYREEKSSITFNTDGTAIASSFIRVWTVGFKGPEGVPSDYSNSSEGDGPLTYEYVINGNHVILFRNLPTEIFDAVYTHVSSPYATKAMRSYFYFDSIGMLGDGFTKLK